ncbi:mitochondrial regulator_of_chromosome_condensation_(RCC1)_repeat- containing_protein AgRCC1_1 [Andalucia godoyi]|uniref:Mitochondrial regulator_of_chromosome_condensation_(RCC1)_repeat-containing_protein AgRCC1_1 n=1 Tax=Andalucia godoyi TaxID=505711 RepID=A0A8K0AJN1_ANDGO|nr:mitochondrial regulator_of_chromosome_condensation_(RCC1)_repeat- containing_protein AgRCC1_1 [Andalucia godoyi]|eukprot:ANDGO_05227.mRNA.1 mitochondrial regulator_of_chromosome_condensation_(RCC1)_repeat- containing_protein AgRCC1_1
MLSRRFQALSLSRLGFRSASTSGSDAPSQGFLYGFGSNVLGQLGTGPVEIKRTHIPEPVRFALSSDPKNFSQLPVDLVAAGSTHSIAVTADGNVWTWGSPQYGQLGLGSSAKKQKNAATLIPHSVFLDLFPTIQSSSSSSSSSAETTTTARIANSGDASSSESNVKVRPVSVAAGAYSSAIAFENGSMLTFGYGGGFFSGVGPLGHSKRGNLSSPALVTGLVGEKVTKVAVGHQHAGAVVDSGEVFMWGKGSWGRLGLGTAYSAAEPAYVHGLKDSRVVDIALGQNHSLALTKEGRVLCWGKNEHFQLGLGLDSAGAYYGGSGFDAVSTPTPIPFFDLIPVRQIAANAFFSACVTVDGRAYVWGNRLFLQPARVVLGRNMDEKAKYISAGPMHLAVISESGKLYVFGRNAELQLGIENKSFRKEFVLTESVSFPVKNVSCGGTFTLVVADTPTSPTGIAS